MISFSHSVQGSPPHARGKVLEGAPPLVTGRITPARAGKRNIFPACLDKVRDHPRTRGEKYEFIILRNSIAGSPPHARGKDGRSIYQYLQEQDHPRTRGEKLLLRVVLMSLSGSPPHARGKVIFSAVSVDFDRITPARAGKSAYSFQAQRTGEDHPRTRGEKNHLRTADTDIGGSPPHARGKVLYQEHPDRVYGITPARAGKSRSPARISTITEDHPRTRGEKSVLKYPAHHLKGSPPHARGKVLRDASAHSWIRITPARAGKRPRLRSYHTQWRDHPRTRGEKSSPEWTICPKVGSPPHARGKESRATLAASAVGITPARAGKSTGKLIKGHPSQDHPRTRGEKSVFSFCRMKFGGSPPHARGKAHDMGDLW